MPKKIDPAVKERVVRRVLEHRQEYSSLTAASAAVARQERLGTETVRRWVLQAQVDAVVGRFVQAQYVGGGGQTVDYTLRGAERGERHAWRVRELGDGLDDAALAG